MPQTLPREDPDFDLRLIQPTAVSGRVVDGEAIPDFGGHFRAKGIRQRFAAMDVQVVQLPDGSSSPPGMPSPGRPLLERTRSLSDLVSRR